MIYQTCLSQKCSSWWEVTFMFEPMILLSTLIYWGRRDAIWSKDHCSFFFGGVEDVLLCSQFKNQNRGGFSWVFYPIGNSLQCFFEYWQRLTMFPLSLCYMCIMETSVKNMSPFGLINAYMYTHTHTHIYGYD